MSSIEDHGALEHCTVSFGARSAAVSLVHFGDEQ